MVWRHAIDVWAENSKTLGYWELVSAGESSDNLWPSVQYATIDKADKRKYVLAIWDSEGMKAYTYHRTLKEAKAVGLVKVRFAQAEAA
jgi:hypothetical protein